MHSSICFSLIIQLIRAVFNFAAMEKQPDNVESSELHELFDLSNIKYDDSTPESLETFVRTALISSGATVHSIDIIPNKNDDKDNMILIHSSRDDYDTWTITITSTSHVFENLEMNYRSEPLPLDLLQRLGKYLMSDDYHAYECDKCREPISEQIHKDLEKSKIAKEDNMFCICKNCEHIRTNSHTESHVPEEANYISFKCEFCAKQYDSEPHLICRKCANLHSYYLCKRCYESDPLNKERKFNIHGEKVSKPNTINELHHELEAEKNWWPEYDFYHVMAKYL